MSGVGVAGGVTLCAALLLWFARTWCKVSVCVCVCVTCMVFLPLSFVTEFCFFIFVIQSIVGVI